MIPIKKEEWGGAFQDGHEPKQESIRTPDAPLGEMSPSLAHHVHSSFPDDGFSDAHQKTLSPILLIAKQDGESPPPRQPCDQKLSTNTSRDTARTAVHKGSSMSKTAIKKQEVQQNRQRRDAEDQRRKMEKRLEEEKRNRARLTALVKQKPENANATEDEIVKQVEHRMREAYQRASSSSASDTVTNVKLEDATTITKSTDKKKSTAGTMRVASKDQLDMKLLLPGNNRILRLQPLSCPYSLISICGKYIVVVLWQRMTSSKCGSADLQQQQSNKRGKRKRDESADPQGTTKTKAKTHNNNNNDNNSHTQHNEDINTETDGSYEKKLSSVAYLIRVVCCPEQDRLRLMGAEGLRNPNNSYLYPSLNALCERIHGAMNAQSVWQHWVIQDGMTYRVNFGEWSLRGGPGWIPGPSLYTEEELVRMKRLALAVRADTMRTKEDRLLSKLPTMGKHFNHEFLPVHLSQFLRVIPTSLNPVMTSGIKSKLGLTLAIPRPSFRPLFLSFAAPKNAPRSFPDDGASSATTKPMSQLQTARPKRRIPFVSTCSVISYSDDP